VSLTRTELLQLVADSYQTDPFRTWRQRDDQMHYRALYVKKDYQLVAIRDGYSAKLARIVDHYQSIRDGLHFDIPEAIREDVLEWYQAKLLRLALKYRDTLTEIRGRALAQFDRNPIGTTYYIDLDGGNDGANGLSTSTAWLTTGQFTSVTVRSAGDIAKIRAGTSQVASADILADEDGTSALGLIELRGCTSLDDPWGDASDVRPIIDFNGGAYAMRWSGDARWGFYNLEVKGSAFNTYNSGQIGMDNFEYFEMKNCKVQEARHATLAYGLVLYGYGFALIEDSIIVGNRNVGIRFDRGHARVRRTTFDGGGTYSQDVGAHLANGAHVIMEESTFGQTTAHDTNDFTAADGSQLYLNGCTSRDLVNASRSGSGVSRWEKHVWAPSGSLAANGSINGCMTIERQTSVVRSGGSDYALKMTPFTNLFTLGKFCHSGLDGCYGHAARAPIVIYLAAGTYTVTVYARADSVFSTYPTADELYLEATYLDEASGQSLAYAKSTQVLSDGSTWVGFSVTITTGQAGHVLCDLRFGKYESGRSIYVDPNPVLS